MSPVPPPSDPSEDKRRLLSLATTSANEADLLPDDEVGLGTCEPCTDDGVVVETELEAPPEPFLALSFRTCSMTLMSL